MHRIQPQAVHVIIPHPHQRVIAEKSPHLIASPVVKINRPAPHPLFHKKNPPPPIPPLVKKITPPPPGVGVPLVVVRPNLAVVVPPGPEVFKAPPHHPPQSSSMASIDQPLHPIRPAIPL